VHLVLARLRRGGPRLALFMVGAFVVGLGFSFFAAMAKTTAWRVTEQLEGRWQTAYDILVRPAGSANQVERDHDLIEANYLSTVSGGISFGQLDAIKDIPGIEVAAPLCILGTTHVKSCAVFYKVLKGFYRVERVEPDNVHIMGRSGASHAEFGYSVPRGVRFDTMDSPVRCFSWPFGDPVNLPVFETATIAAIDPEAETVLVGLDEAVIDGRYFDETDGPTWTPWEGQDVLNLPVLVSTSSCPDIQWRVTFGELPFPPTQEGADRFLAMTAAELESLPAASETRFVLDEAQVRANLYRMMNTDPDRPYDQKFILIPEQPGPRRYYVIDRGDAAESVQVCVKPYYGTAYRPRKPVAGFTGGPYDIYPLISVAVGLFDPQKLRLGADPLTNLPMETYRPVNAWLVKDAEGRPLEPRLKVHSLDPLQGLLTQPATVLTTVEAARELYGEECISAVRVRVAGADASGTIGQQRVEAAAEEIHARTGLEVNVTYGSSPTRTVVYVDGLTLEESIAAWERLKREREAAGPPPARNSWVQVQLAPLAPRPVSGVEPFGYVQEPWVRKNVHISIVEELDRGNLVVLGAVLLVAVIFVLCTTLVSVLARRRELGVLAGLGWRRGTLVGLVMSEPLLAGGVTALAGMALAVLVAQWRELQMPLAGTLVSGGLAVAVYALGSAVPGLWARRTPPFTAMRRGEISARAGRRPAVRRRGRRGASVTVLALRSVGRRWGRNSLSLVCVTVSTALLAAFCVVTWRMQGVLYGTLLGEYLAWQVGPQHFALAGVSLAISALAMADLLSLNVAERRGELAVLQAVGWRPRSLQRLVFMEGVALGSIGGLLGCLGAAWVLMAFYQTPLVDTVLTCILVIPVPVIVGLLGALVPAGLALRQSPAHGVRWE